MAPPSEKSDASGQDPGQPSRPKPAAFDKLNRKLRRNLSEKASQSSGRSSLSSAASDVSRNKRETPSATATATGSSAPPTHRQTHAAGGGPASTNLNPIGHKPQQDKRKGEEVKDPPYTIHVPGPETQSESPAGKARRDEGEKHPVHAPGSWPDPEDSDIETLASAGRGLEETRGKLPAIDDTPMSRSYLPQPHSDAQSLVRNPSALSMPPAFASANLVPVPVPVPTGSTSTSTTMQSDTSTHYTNHYETHTHNYGVLPPTGNDTAAGPVIPGHHHHQHRTPTQSREPKRKTRKGVASAGILSLLSCSCSQVLMGCCVILLAAVLLLLFLGAMSALSTINSASNMVSSWSSWVVSIPGQALGLLSIPASLFASSSSQSSSPTFPPPLSPSSTSNPPTTTLTPTPLLPSSPLAPALSSAAAHLTALSSTYGPHLHTHHHPVASALSSKADIDALASRHARLAADAPAMHRALEGVLNRDAGRVGGLVGRVRRWGEGRGGRFEGVVAGLEERSRRGWWIDPRWWFTSSHQRQPWTAFLVSELHVSRSHFVELHDAVSDGIDARRNRLVAGLRVYTPDELVQPICGVAEVLAGSRDAVERARMDALVAERRYEEKAERQRREEEERAERGGGIGERVMRLFGYGGDVPVPASTEADEAAEKRERKDRRDRRAKVNELGNLVWEFALALVVGSLDKEVTQLGEVMQSVEDLIAEVEAKIREFDQTSVDAASSPGGSGLKERILTKAEVETKMAQVQSLLDGWDAVVIKKSEAWVALMAKLYTDEEAK
ncbi:hypothetical protein QBC33DRAFT_574466 [Phialemonium atrogriseum]|uniref:Uncharacterized protein n=1 Tax=Phialemonium atrogriseum TaxID=1093897 RepID=A0AAJ0FHG5_9PEZI|nr:uncharacterized protein QBC33DRAFT_574466 [Phialemonium atrogriseum]KAK1762149.1 hypothetical protein QBC33DRAFT_574466 [Phialemonium atrogriseum]